jgi:uncharacterized protein
MHPAVNGYISDAFYDGRLRTHPSTSRQRVDALVPLVNGSGIRFVGLEHEGNGPSSTEEAIVVAQAVRDLVGQSWIGPDGDRRTITPDDILVVAPYNAHVATIAAATEAALGSGVRVRVGTVDKFQGQEGAVAIYSMASSSQDDAPRDMEFLYSRHRLNVAVSRARAVALVVASPRLLDASCRTPGQMRLVDALCRLIEEAELQAGPPDLTLGLE